MTDTPIEDYLDDLLRRSGADARTTRRLLDEAGDHLYATASALEAGGLPRPEAEREAVRRFGAADPLLRSAHAHSLRRLISETAFAAVSLGAVGLVAVGLSGLVALVMNVAFGRSFVGATTIVRHGASVTETADDAVVLRLLAAVVGVVVLLGCRVLRGHLVRSTVLPAGLVDTLGAAAFAAAVVGLGAASIDQAGQGHGPDGVGFFLSGALVAVAGAVAYSIRAIRALIPPPSPDASGG